MTKFVIGVVGLLLAAELASCSRPAASGQARMAACQELGRVKAGLVRLGDLSRPTTVEELQGARDELGEAIAALRDHAAAIGASDMARLERAYGEFDGALRELPDGATAAQARAQLGDEVAGLRQAWMQANSDLDCPGDEGAR